MNWERLTTVLRFLEELGKMVSPTNVIQSLTAQKGPVPERQGPHYQVDQTLAAEYRNKSAIDDLMTDSHRTSSM